MLRQLNRRDFLATTAAAGFLTALSIPNSRAEGLRGKIRKAMIVKEVSEKSLEPLKAAGFDGVETNHICPEEEAARGREVAAKLGMRVHSVLRGWMEFNSEDPQTVEESLEKVRKGLRAAKGYGDRKSVV